MQCPKCKEISTFTINYISSTEYYAPLFVNEQGEVRIDYDDAEEDGWCGDDIDGDGEMCLCDKCNKRVVIDDIEIVETKDEVLAE